jgi:uncharacterized LabA/DUF88 family protein
MHNENEINSDRGDVGFPSDEQLRLLLENLFERQRLVELAHRCTTRDDKFDLRQARSHELIEILIEAWKVGPQRTAGSIWGAVDQELTGRLKNYLGLGEIKLREQLETLQSEGSVDRKTACILLWVLLHEKQTTLLEEFETMLSRGFRDSGRSLLAQRPLCLAKIQALEERVEGMGRELKGLLIEQTREIESMRKQLGQLEGGAAQYAVGNESARRGLEEIPEENIRVGVFIDVQNMFYAAKKLDGARLDYESILDLIIGKRRQIMALTYVVESPEIDQSGFISLLKKKGYQVRRKELKSFTDGTAKGDWDMGIAIDIIEAAKELDVVALVSGDGDFVSLVHLIKRLGPIVELYAFGPNLSSELRETADKFVEIGSEMLLKDYGNNSSGHNDSPPDNNPFSHHEHSA